MPTGQRSRKLQKLHCKAKSLTGMEAACMKEKRGCTLKQEVIKIMNHSAESSFSIEFMHFFASRVSFSRLSV